MGGILDNPSAFNRLMTRNGLKVNKKVDYKTPSALLIEEVDNMIGIIPEGIRKQWRVTIIAESLRLPKGCQDVEKLLKRKLPTDVQQKRLLNDYFDSVRDEE